ncbi:hypothetical protein AB670_02963 [Chryseobacterium sp. MOF25P]|uniref:hypothetical protein n=1 Tax=unclassified Chryseobacterium TaxID=2593645 RepID=UPI0008056D56|nr:MULTISPECIES: hypothetical protein [unclassified Chryseobacterium]OBW40684.1 hypothetical protein AB670_02963 [Chryseobacterium sp. MOF25P]OBW45370.1 hypothetical protein AB671_02491 [Chryseobacterium sp. BGARF1]
MDLKSYFFLILLYFFSSKNIFNAQITKQEIIEEVDFINSKTSADEEYFHTFQQGHSPDEEQVILTDEIQNDKEKPIPIVLKHYWYLYDNNFAKTTIYLKNSIPIYIIKEKKATLNYSDSTERKEVLISHTKFYIYNWEKWVYEKEIINDGRFLLENSIEKKEIENIIIANQKK